MSLTLWVILCLVGAGIIIFIGGIIYGQGQRITKEEELMPLPGDDYISEKDRVMRVHAGITIYAPPSKIWPYLEQMGQQHAGFYSFDFIERICGFGINNLYALIPEWQNNLRPGFFMRFHKNGIGMEVIEVEKERYFAMISDSRKSPSPENKGCRFFSPFRKGSFAFTWVFNLTELPKGKTRLLMRADLHFAPRTIFTWLFTGLTQIYPSFIMITGLCRGIKACAEGRK